MDFESKLTEVSHDISLNSAPSVYLSTAQNIITELPEPTSIKDELGHLKEFSSKLKFQYLEQETRDKFLRLMLIEREQNITQAEVDALVEQNRRQKQSLKDIKTEMYSLIKSSEAVAEEVISLNRSFEARYGDVTSTLEDISNMQKELDNLLNEPENENHKALFNLKKIIDTEDIGLNEAINIATNALDQEALVLSQLEHNVEKTRIEHSSQTQVIDTLTEKLKKLEGLLQEAGNRPKDQQEPQQVFAQWLRELNMHLEKFIPMSLRLGESAQTLMFGPYQLEFDKELNITKCSDKTISSATIEEINHAKKEAKFWKLLHLLCRLIFRAEM